MNAFKLSAIAASMAICLLPPAVADVITDWNITVLNAGNAARQTPVGQTPAVQARNMAMVHLAMFDAVNSIEPRYTPYRMQLKVPSDTSREAAASAAAHYLIVRLYPAQAKDADAALATALASVPEGAGKTQGVQLGEKVAAALLEERSKDGANVPDTYRPHGAAGAYVPTVLTASWNWGLVKPFAMTAGNQFRPSAPYALNSAQWAKDFNEVKTIGAKTDSARTPEQTDIAKFWEQTGAGSFNQIVEQVAAAKKLSLMENARLYAQVYLATADAFIAIFDAKYAYNFWRPLTAIRNGDADGNDATTRDAAWSPFITTPMHPEYPCAHCIAQSSAATVLNAYFGDNVPTATMTSPSAPGVKRSFSRLSDYKAEIINARIYDGVHYRTSGEVGVEMGRKIGEHVTQNFLKTLR
ncbi:MAG: vanadium-dependent haloperoxidase [Burkholderiaceae bacterium]